jgi:hypothetical protein
VIPAHSCIYHESAPLIGTGVALAASTASTSPPRPASRSSPTPEPDSRSEEALQLLGSWAATADRAEGARATDQSRGRANVPATRITAERTASKLAFAVSVSSPTPHAVSSPMLSFTYEIAFASVPSLSVCCW